jgi:orotidine-5'-phosphate decarboxylase
LRDLLWFVQAFAKFLGGEMRNWPCEVYEAVVLALDNMNLSQAVVLTSKVGKYVYAVKANSLQERYGHIVEQVLHEAGARRVWLDKKFHDIPNTVQHSVAAQRGPGGSIFTVHASGGVPMMKAARDGFPDATFYAITALTSLSEEEIAHLYGQNRIAVVSKLASWAVAAGMDGVVCSTSEVAVLAEDQNFASLELIVPGSRSVGQATHDQKNVNTPYATILAGATRLVAGRQVTEATDPVAALDEFFEEVAQGLTERSGV